MSMNLSIGAGGALGALGRHYAMAFWARWLGEGFPYGTVFVNVFGSLVIGMVMEGLALKFNAPLEARAFFVTGFLGAFTTFSAFSLDVFRLVETGQVVQAIAYISASVALSILAVFGGVFLMRGIL